MTTAVSSADADADRDLLQALLSQARQAGADGAEAVMAERRSLGVGVREGRLEEVEREEAQDLGLRVFVGGRQASASTSDLSAEARGRLVERVVAMARLAPEDPHAKLAHADQLATGPFADLELRDHADPQPDTLQGLAIQAEATALSFEGIARSEGAHASLSGTRWRLMTTEGFDGAYGGTAYGLAVGVIAEKDGAMERGGESRTTRWFEDLPSPDTLGRVAADRAVARLGARKIASITAPVIFENRVATQLLSPLLGAISGPAVARGTSFLMDAMDTQVFSDGFDLIDDPFVVRGLGSTPFDDEGVRVERREIVRDGTLTTWLLNTASASQLGLTSTGHAARALVGPAGVSTHNLTVRPGDRSRDALMRDAGAGLLVTSMFGPSLNGNTGDWSAGVSGFWFEGGEIAYPVTEVTVAGNLKALWKRLVVGDDLERRGRFDSPSLAVDAVAIAGK